MYTTVETIEHDIIKVCSVCSLWVEKEYLRWPPDGEPNRRIICAPEDNWLRFQCKVLCANIGK